MAALLTVVMATSLSANSAASAHGAALAPHHGLRALTQRRSACANADARAAASGGAQSEFTARLDGHRHLRITPQIETTRALPSDILAPGGVHAHVVQPEPPPPQTWWVD